MKKLLSKANKRISFGSAASLLIVAALASQSLGFLRNRLISTNFTAVSPGSSDAFFAAFQIPDFFFYTIAAGALGVAFIPIFADKLESGNTRLAWELTSSLLNFLVLAMGAVSILLFIFAKPLIHLIAPDLPEVHLAQAVLIMQLVSLNPLLFALSGLLTSVQQATGRFFFYAAAPIVYNLSIIASIFIFKDNIGIVGLGIGALVGAILQLIVAIIGMLGSEFKYHRRINWHTSGFREVMRRLPARSLDQGVDQVNSIVETNRAQTLGLGAISSYNYALTLMNVPVMLLGNSIATAAFPKLVDRLAKKQPDQFRRDFIHILRGMIWVTAPVLVVCYFCRAYLARMVFGRVAPAVALIFGYLIFAILFRIIYSMMSRWFYAQKDTKTPLYVSLFAIGLNVYLAFTLARPDSYGVAGLALAQSIVAIFEVFVLTIIIFARDRKIFDKFFQQGLLRIISVTGFSMTATFIMISLLPLNATDRGFVTLFFKLGAISFVTFVVHVSFSLMLGLQEARFVVSQTKRFIYRPVKIQ
ncbi:MAG: murein biosynthesis integral membrane protein MurJ [bacterium]|nr:murein biosynthesis integral membrane protein MurJ [bacterium]